MKVENPALSIVTGAFGRSVSLLRLINSIIRETQVSWELIVSDATLDQSYWTTSRAFNMSAWDVSVINENPRLGHVKGYNEAFRFCRGEYVMWLNDDVEVLPGYDTRGISLLQSNPQVGLGCFYYRTADRLDKGFHVNSVWGMIFANFGIIRRELGNQLGWFDEDFYFYGGDNSITFRTLIAGYGVVQVPGPSIIHHAPQDEIRAQNELNRPKDSEKLWSKYAQHRMKMRETYGKFRVGPLQIKEEREDA